MLHFQHLAERLLIIIRSIGDLDFENPGLAFGNGKSKVSAVDFIEKMVLSYANSKLDEAFYDTFIQECFPSLSRYLVNLKFLLFMVLLLISPLFINFQFRRPKVCRTSLMRNHPMPFWSFLRVWSTRG